ncbi:MAG: hypothetical protein AAFN74_12265, partial [Myxococcota bacterium]
LDAARPRTTQRRNAFAPSVWYALCFLPGVPKGPTTSSAPLFLKNAPLLLAPASAEKKGPPLKAATPDRRPDATDIARSRSRFDSVQASLKPKPKQQLDRFIRLHRVPTRMIAKVGKNRVFRGREKLAAQQMYAVVYDAAHHGKVGPQRARRFIKHVLPALSEGRIRIRMAVDDAYHAAYHGRNQPTGRYSPNTLYLSPHGLDISKRATRGILVHESEHIAFDSMRVPRTRLESERIGHGAFADYMLRDSGAMIPVPGGFKLDPDAFHRVQFRHYNSIDRKVLFDTFAKAAQKNADNGRLDLNGTLAELGRRVGQWITSNSGLPQTFEDVYVDALKTNNPNYALLYRDEIRAMLSQPVAADGLP